MAEAQHNLGMMYSNGRGITKDKRQAAVLFRQAAEQGLAKSQLQLGVMYLNGEGVSQDAVQAVAWYYKAAEQGSADAQYLLGMMYESGLGIAQDQAQAVTWYSKAAEQGMVEAQQILDEMSRTERGTANNNSPSTESDTHDDIPLPDQIEFSAGFVKYPKGVKKDFLERYIPEINCYSPSQNGDSMICVSGVDSLATIFIRGVSCMKTKEVMFTLKQGKTIGATCDIDKKTANSLLRTYTQKYGEPKTEHQQVFRMTSDEFKWDIGDEAPEIVYWSGFDA